MKNAALKSVIPFMGLMLIFSLLFLDTNGQVTASAYDNNWPEWRGYHNTGAALKGNPPADFSETKNVKWKIDIPGKGHATPIVWGNQIIVQTAVPTAQKPADAAGDESETEERSWMTANRAQNIYKYFVISVDKNTGKINWQTEVNEEFPLESTHELGSWASNSPVTDGENIFAYFGSRGLYCLDFNGNVLWSRDFGQLEKHMSFGEGSSPAVCKNNVYVQWDHEGQSFIYAIDKKTGEDAWVDKRDEPTSWSTPLLLNVNGKTQVITSATTKVRGYDASTGDVIWECSGLTRNVIPNPVYADGILYVMSGFRGNALKAIDLANAKGDIDGTDVILWEHNENTPYTPCPVLMDGKLYFMRTNNGFLSCLDAKTGEVYYSSERLDGISTLYSSPTGAGGKLYIVAGGVVNVIKAGPEFEIIAKNTIDDDFHASPVVIGDELFLRGFTKLYCISEK